MLITVLFLILTLFTILAFAVLAVMAIARIVMRLFRKVNHKRPVRIKPVVVFLAVVITCGVLLVVVSQLTASTPRIVDENGDTPANAIAELTQVELNGRKEWISLRGLDAGNPVLLFLAGGPGGTQMAAVRYELAALEKHFVVVNWDQPGAGKSYGAARTQDITVETYIEDGYALTQYLLGRFSQDKIYLVGESWGSALGIFLIDRYPEAYYGFVGTAQMVDFLQTERLDYTKAMEIALARSDKATIERLQSIGEPPYYGGDVVWKSAVYLNYLSGYMAADPAISNPGYNTFRDIFAQEYGLLDKINYARGVIYTFSHVYQQLYAIDLRKEYARLEVPVHFFLGRQDINAPTSLVEEYLAVLDAPYKEIVWFEHSGHSPWINEREKFAEEVLRCFVFDTTKE